MAVNYVFIVSVATCMVLAVVYGQTPIKLDQVCLGCICEASSGCNETLTCIGEVCGPFQITWGYWADGGKPTLHNESNTETDAYPRCVNDPFCAARAVEGYMNKFGQDCNGDGIIDCKDFGRIHHRGAYTCSGELEPHYEKNFNDCLETYV